MVSKVFCKYYESNWNISSKDCDEVFTSNGVETFASTKHKGELRKCEDTAVFKSAVVDYNHFRAVECFSKQSKERSTKITCKNTNDKRNETAHFFAVSRAEHCNCESNKSTCKTDVNAATFCA